MLRGFFVPKLLGHLKRSTQRSAGEFPGTRCCKDFPGSKDPLCLHAPWYACHRTLKRNIERLLTGTLGYWRGRLGAAGTGRSRFPEMDIPRATRSPGRRA